MSTECRSCASSRSKTKSFDDYYRSYCKSKNTSPLRNLLKNGDFTLDFCVDKIKFNQWEPILLSIGEDISLECLSIRCRTPTKAILENVDNETKARTVVKTPAVLTRFVLWKLIDAISQCLSQTPILSILQIEGLPLSEPYIELLSEALSANTTLKHVGFNGCQIGDLGCQKVCVALRNSASVLSVSFSGCNLTPKGVAHVADLLNFLKIMRYSENWQHTLRYQSPDLDAMNGLRTISLSDNLQIGDDGLLLILDVLKDDLWIKALDLQYCGITDNIVKDCLEFFENNSSIQMMDLRFNQQLSTKSYGIIISEMRKNECSSAKCAQWSLLANNPVFKNNQKAQTQKQLATVKDKNNKISFSAANPNKYDNGDSHNADSSQVHLLKKELKNEIIMRKKLEELNAKLLQQVKELKANQIANWKAHAQQNNIKEGKGEEIGDGNAKTKRDVITIDLNQEIDNCLPGIPENTVADYKPKLREQEQSIVENRKSEIINLRECTGVNLLESFLQQRSAAQIQNAHHDGYSSEASSESSENTLCYLSESSRSTVKCVNMQRIQH